ncbi:hypothetical protein [Microbacterium sp. MMO-56]|uniref:hypothetical protein n=1 Tax=Microbacterium sp. MMO-56 TaxID=3081281 RepID=UPI003019A918
MSDWPSNLTVAPIREWPGALTPRRTPSNFSASWSATLAELSREMRHLNARNGELLVAVRPDDFRRDGKPRANAKQEHPGVILSFDSSVGHLSYPCDTFTRWQDNVRAITLALEALRKVDRYGVTKRGEQYRGFLALEATAAPEGFATADEALAFLGAFIGLGVAEMKVILSAPARALRRAQRDTHPDFGGDAATFQRVSLAEAKLRAEGLL